MTIQPQFNFLFQCLPIKIDDEILRKWQQMISDYRWNYKKLMIKELIMPDRKEPGSSWAVYSKVSPSKFSWTFFQIAVLLQCIGLQPMTLLLCQLLGMAHGVGAGRHKHLRMQSMHPHSPDAASLCWAMSLAPMLPRRSREVDGLPPRPRREATQQLVWAAQLSWFCTC